jgi:hypothetical protein
VLTVTLEPGPESHCGPGHTLALVLSCVATTPEGVVVPWTPPSLAALVSLRHATCSNAGPQPTASPHADAGPPTVSVVQEVPGVCGTTLEVSPGDWRDLVLEPLGVNTDPEEDPNREVLANESPSPSRTPTPSPSPGLGPGLTVRGANTCPQDGGCDSGSGSGLGLALARIPFRACPVAVMSVDGGNGTWVPSGSHLGGALRVDLVWHWGGAPGPSDETLDGLQVLGTPGVNGTLPVPTLGVPGAGPVDLVPTVTSGTTRSRSGVGPTWWVTTVWGPVLPSGPLVVTVPGATIGRGAVQAPVPRTPPGTWLVPDGRSGSPSRSHSRSGTASRTETPTRSGSRSSSRSGSSTGSRTATRTATPTPTPTATPTGTGTATGTRTRTQTPVGTRPGFAVGASSSAFPMDVALGVGLGGGAALLVLLWFLWSACRNRAGARARARAQAGAGAGAGAGA